MKYIWGFLCVVLAISTVGGILQVGEGKEDFAAVIPFILATLLFGWLTRRSFRKGKLNVSTKPKCSISKNEDFDAIIENFFTVPVEQSVRAAKQALPDQAKARQAVIDYLPYIIEKSLSDHLLTNEEEKSIEMWLSAFNITSLDVPEYSTTLLVKGATLRDLMEGVVKSRVDVPGLPFNLMKSEILVWAFSDVTISEIKTSKEWESGSQGVSIRIAKGVYWNLGATKGKRVEKQVLQELGSSIIAITSKHIYMLCNGDAQRISHDKIISIVPDSESVTVFRDGARKNPLCFTSNDSWFFANVLQNAKNWDV